MENSIWAKRRKPIRGTDCKGFSIPHDIFEEEFVFEPIGPKFIKPGSDKSTNVDDTD